jgi:hypothetical protein
VAYLLIGLIAAIGFLEYCCCVVAGRADREEERLHCQSCLHFE